MRRLLGVIPWVVVVGFVAIGAMPASVWMSVDSVRVADAVEGASPAIAVDRHIRRDFAAEWVSTVRRAGANGGFVAVCTASGRNDYKTSSVLPADLNLDWWTDPVKCGLNPGEYILTTRWIIDTPTPWDKIVTVTSNVFTIKPKPP